MKITDSQLKQIYAHAKETYPRECFGFLMGHFDDCGQVSQIVLGTNLNTERNDRFDMDPKEFIQLKREAEETGLAVIGFYHSHPDWPAIPSQTDIDFAWDGMFYLIVAVHQGIILNTKVWRLADDEPRRFQQAILEIMDEKAGFNL